MKSTLLILVAVATACSAQETIAPTREIVGRSRGADHGNYNVLQSYELGVRVHRVNGNKGKYRSDVNFGNGLRLLGARFSLNSKDGHGGIVDELTVSVQGIGNDPYQFASARARKGNLFQYDLFWRQSDYFNPALPIARGLHSMETRRQLQDHELTVFPRGRVRFFGGYSRSAQRGPTLTTALLLDTGGVEFPLFADVNRRQGEFRIGNEVKFFGLKLHWIRAWERYEEDSPVSGAPGTTVGDTTLDSFRRSEPYSGTTPSWRVNLFHEESSRWAMNGRFTESSGRRNFVLDEAAVGTERFGGARNRQVVVAGDGRRPVVTGQLTLSLFAGQNITLTNHTGYHNTRMEGNAQLAELENSSQAFSLLSFQSLAIRNLTNVTDLNWRAADWIQLRGGYQYADRRIRSVEQETFFGTKETIRAEQSNCLNAGIAGFRLQPFKPFSVSFDAEIGRQDRPVYPTSDRDYHGFSGRASWRQKNLRLSALVRTFYNFNSVSPAVHSARGRQYSYDAAWFVSDVLSVDAGYAKLHSDTSTSLAYFVSFAPVRGERSVWISNIHSAHIGATARVHRLVDLYAGYSIVQDTGDGRALAGQSPGPPASSLPSFVSAQTFPMLFDSPMARLSVRLHEKLRWNAGYQYYRYREDFSAIQDYRAHTGYVSILWTF